MIIKACLLVAIAVAITLSGATMAFPGHKEEQGVVKGTVTKIEAVEYVITVKDDKGKEKKIKVKDAAGLKVGESVVIKEGKAVPAVKPKAGGY